MNIFDHLFQSAAGHSVSSGAVIRPLASQVVEVTGSESPSTFGWISRNQRTRNDLSRARLRAIESSLENGQVWVPSSPAHRKTWEEEVNSYLHCFLSLVSTIKYRGKSGTNIGQHELYLE